MIQNYNVLQFVFNKLEITKVLSIYASATCVYDSQIKHNDKHFVLESSSVYILIFLIMWIESTSFFYVYGMLLVTNLCYRALKWAS